MSEHSGPWVAGEAERRRRPGLVATVATGVVVLAIVGGTVGYVLAGPGTGAVGQSPPSSAPPATTASSPTPSASPSAAASDRPGAGPSATTGTGDFTLPDVVDEDFEDARRRLRNLRLGVQLRFGSSGDDRSVERTEPAAGESVHAGITVKLYVRGRAPLATVPNVVGLACNEAGAIVADHGLTPRYPTGRTGRVLWQDPVPPTDSLRWLDQVSLHCGSASPSPTSD